MSRKHLISFMFTFISFLAMFSMLPPVEKLIERYPPRVPNYWGISSWVDPLSGYLITLEKWSASFRTRTLYEGKLINFVVYNYEVLTSPWGLLMIFASAFTLFFATTTLDDLDIFLSNRGIKIGKKGIRELFLKVSDARKILVASALSLFLLQWMRILYFNLIIFRFISTILFLYVTFYIEERSSSKPPAALSVLDGILVSSLMAVWFRKPIADVLVWATTAQIILLFMRIGELEKDLRVLGYNGDMIEFLGEMGSPVSIFLLVSLINITIAYGGWANLP